MELYQQAIKDFGIWWAEALKLHVPEPTAMSVATVDAEGRPSVRTLLLKGYGEDGFCFFTNRNSRKGHDLAENPRAARCFFWQQLKRQVHVEGRVIDASDADANAYWATRPRESRIGAWASQQSEPLTDRQELLDRYAEFDRQYPDDQIPRPPHWGGYCLVPERIEFWQGRAHRLHDRRSYQLAGQRDGHDHWTLTLLNP
jgi:pyridoxamine 5'-phosphate oxidase